VADGEGVVGLAWATLLAGAKSVVVSQWRVDAASTDKLMLGFYRRLEVLRRAAGGADVADALRGASLALLADPRTRHPFFWAGFVPIGVTRLGGPTAPRGTAS
jgi:CHAT domain-containing protein